MSSQGSGAAQRQDSGRTSRLRRIAGGVLLLPALAFMAFKTYRSWGEISVAQLWVRPGYLLLAGLALLVSFLLNGLIWHLVVRSHGAQSRFRRNLEIYCLTSIVRRLPGAVWQVAGRVWLYRQEGLHGLSAVQGSIWEVMVQLLSALAVFGLCAPWYGGRLPRGANLAWLLLALLLPFVIRPALLQRLMGPVRRWLRAGDEFTISVRTRNVAVWFAIYIVSWLNGGLILYLMLAGFYRETAPSMLPVLCGFVALSGLVGICVSPIPGGLGLRELSLSVLMGRLVPEAIAVSSAVAFRLWLLVGEAVFAGLILAVTRSRLLGFGVSEREKHQMRANPLPKRK